MDADTKDREPTEEAPREGTLLELSADPPETELDIDPPGPGEVMVQVSGPTYDLAEDAQVHEGTEAPPGFAFELLLLAAPARRVDLIRTPVARFLLQGPLWPPLRQERFAVLMGEGYGPDDVMAAAERVLPRVLYLWGQDRGRAQWRTFLPWLRNKLNDAVPREEELLGPDWRKIVGKDPGDPPKSLDAPADGRDSEEGPLHEHLAAAGSGAYLEALEAEEQLQPAITALVAMLDAASPQQREILLAWHLDPELLSRLPTEIELTDKERELVAADPETKVAVGELLGISPGQVRTQYKRCKNKLNN